MTKRWWFVAALVLGCSSPGAGAVADVAVQAPDGGADVPVAASDSDGGGDGFAAQDSKILDAAGDAAASDGPDAQDGVAAEDQAAGDADQPGDAAPTDASADADSDGGGAPVLVGVGEPGGILTSAGCVVPDGAPVAGCAGNPCQPGETCTGPGTCVPDAGFWVEPSAPANQSWAAVATRADGAYAVAWSAGSYFEGKQTVWLRVFAAGTAVGGVSLAVSATDSAANLAPSVASMADGSWLVLWRADDMANDELRFLARRVTADGTANVDKPFQVNATALSSGGSSGGTNIIAPLVVRLRNGRLLMAWSGAAKATAGGGAGPLGIYARLFDAEGQPLGGELDTGGLAAGGASFSPAIAALAGGQALLAWEGPVAGGKGPRIVRARAFGDQGTPLGPVLTLTPGAQDYEALPAVVGYLSGETLVTYKAGDNPTSTSAVTVRGRLIGANLPVTSGVALPAGVPSDLDFDSQGTYPGAAAATTLSAQRAMAVWHNLGKPNPSLWARRHYRAVDAWDCEPVDLGGPQLPSEAGARYLPALAGWDNGKWVLAFSTSQAGMDQYRVAVRLGAW